MHRALGANHRVARLNISICRNDWDRDWPGPKHFPKLIRRIVFSLKTCWSGARKALSSFSGIATSIGQGTHLENSAGNDIELGEHDQGEVESSLPEPLYRTAVEVAKDGYFSYLKETFGEEELPSVIMKFIKRLENGR